jgi:hypothetical protein
VAALLRHPHDCYWPIQDAAESVTMAPHAPLLAPRTLTHGGSLQGCHDGRFVAVPLLQTVLVQEAFYSILDVKNGFQAVHKAALVFTSVAQEHQEL